MRGQKKPYFNGKNEKFKQQEALLINMGAWRDLLPEPDENNDDCFFDDDFDESSVYSKPNRDPEKDRENGTLSYIYEQASELYVKVKLKKEGYSNCKIAPKDQERKPHFDEINVKKTLTAGGAENEFDKIKNLLTNFGNIKVGVPDIIFAKDGKVGFVEVKSNNNSLSDRQKEFILLLKEKGYAVNIKRVFINIEKVSEE